MPPAHQPCTWATLSIRASVSCVGTNGRAGTRTDHPFCLRKLIVAKLAAAAPNGGNACVFPCRGQSRWVMAWLAVDLLGVGRPVPDGGADKPQRSARVVSDQAEQPLVGQLRLRAPADLTAPTASLTSGPLASAARRPVGPGRNTVPGCSLMRRASSTSRFAAEDSDMPGLAATKEARRSTTAPSDRTASAPSPVNCGRWRGCGLGSRQSGRPFALSAAARA